MELSPAAQAEPTEARIRRVAAELFYERGYHATTMRDIAAGVGIKAGSLYNHYPGKQSILFGICLSTVRELHDGLVSRLASVEDVEERVRTFVTWHVDFHTRNRHVARVADGQLHALDPDHRHDVIAVRDAYEGLLREMLEQGARVAGWRAANLRVIVMAITAMCTEVDTWYRDDGSLTPGEIGDIYAGFILNGLRIA